MTSLIIKNNQYQPFVKWVGGKRGLLKDNYLLYFDSHYYLLTQTASFTSLEKEN